MALSDTYSKKTDGFKVDASSLSTSEQDNPLHGEPSKEAIPVRTTEDDAESGISMNPIINKGVGSVVMDTRFTSVSERLSYGIPLDAEAPLVSNTEITTVFGVNVWVLVCFFAGTLSGLWSPLATIGRTGPGAVGNPYNALFLFMSGQMTAVLVILSYGGLVARSSKSDAWLGPMEYFRMITLLPKRDIFYGILAGFLVGTGHFFYYTASEVVPSTIAFSVGGCAPLVTIILGVFVKKNLVGAPFGQVACTAMSSFLFIVAILLIMFSK